MEENNVKQKEFKQGKLEPNGFLSVAMGRVLGGRGAGGGGGGGCVRGVSLSFPCHSHNWASQTGTIGTLISLEQLLKAAFSSLAFKDPRAM